jgi:hypothetical protein
MTSFILLSVVPLIGGSIALALGFYAAAKVSPLRKVKKSDAAAEATDKFPTGMFVFERIEDEYANDMGRYAHHNVLQITQVRPTTSTVMGPSRLAGAE